MPGLLERTWRASGNLSFVVETVAMGESEDTVMRVESCLFVVLFVQRRVRYYFLMLSFLKILSLEDLSSS